MARVDDVALFSAFDEETPWDPSTPEKNLLRALLVTAMADVRKTGIIRKKALEYFLDVDDEQVFSFRTVCSYLNIDPQSVLVAVHLADENAQAKRKVA